MRIVIKTAGITHNRLPRSGGLSLKILLETHNVQAFRYLGTSTQRFQHRGRQLYTIFASGNNNEISNYFLNPTQNTLDLGLQCAIINGNDKITKSLVEKGANPLYDSCAVINFKRFTWPIFHRSKQPEASNSSLNAEIEDSCHDSYDDSCDDSCADSCADSCDESIDYSLDDGLSFYENDDCEAGVLPVQGRATTALQIAAVIGKTTILKALLIRTKRRSEKISYYDQTGRAVYYHAEMQTVGDSPLIIAAWMGHLGALKIFFSYREIFWFNEEASLELLNVAAARGHLRIVKYLIEMDFEEKPENYIDKNFSGYGTPLCAASLHGRIGVAEWLVKNGASVNPVLRRDVDPPLTNAVINNKFKMIRFLLNKGADLNLSLLDDCSEFIKEKALNSLLRHAPLWQYHILCMKCRIGDDLWITERLKDRKFMSKLRKLDQATDDDLGRDGPVVIALKNCHTGIPSELKRTNIACIFHGMPSQL